MPSKPAPIRRTESPKGASTNSRRRGGRKTTNLRNKIRAGPCVLEEGEYRCFKPAVVFLPMGVPFGGVPFGVGCSVGSSGKPSSPTAIQIRPLRGRCSPHAVQGTTYPYDTEGRCRRNQRPYTARGPRRGLLPIAVGEEDEGRRTYGTQSCRAVRPRRGRISVNQNQQLCFYRWASPSGASLSVLGWAK